MHALSEHPAASEFAPAFQRYVVRVPRGDVLRTLARQTDETTELLRGLTEERGGFRYAPGKWSIREMLGHMIDAERIFDHRALVIAREDPTPLPPFDEDAYARASRSDSRTLAELLAEMEIVRKSTIALFSSFDAQALGRRGIANNIEISVRALAFIIAGHERHHIDVLRTRYLNA